MTQGLIALEWRLATAVNSYRRLSAWTKPVTIKDVKVITTQPAGSRLVIVKVITSEPGLYGLGCATFTQRWNAVVAALEKHLIPFALGRDVARIEEFWRWRWCTATGATAVLNNAISGIDQALWDIKGKLANMPVYDLLGGKCREAAAVYTHADGRSPRRSPTTSKFDGRGLPLHPHPDGRLWRSGRCDGQARGFPSRRVLRPPRVLPPHAQDDGARAQRGR